MRHLKHRLKLLLMGTAFGLLVLFASFSAQAFRRGPRVVIGAKNCTEQHILGEILAQLIERETNLRVVRKFNLEGTTICFNALKSKTIDLYVEYTGTAILDILKEGVSDRPLYPYVREVFEEKYEILWLDRLGFSNQYVLIARADLGVKKISDLEKIVGIRMAYDPEFAARLELKLLSAHYGGMTYQKLMDQVLLYFSLDHRSIDVMSGFSTDGRLFGPKFVILEDDHGALPTYEAAPIVAKACLTKHPELKKVLQKLAGAISTERMSHLNYLVEIEGKDVKEVAANFLASSD